MKPKSLEQRLYEAWRSGTGVRLTHEDLHSLLRDDAIATRICNTAAVEAGGEEPGMCGGIWLRRTWKVLGRVLADGTEE